VTMFARIRKFLAPPVFEDEGKMRVAGALYVALSGVTIITLIAFAVVIADDPGSIGLTEVILGTASALFLVLNVVLRLGYVHLVGALILLIVWVEVTIPIFTYGLKDTAITAYYAVIVLAAFLLNKRIMVIFSALCLLSTLGAYLAEINGLIEPVPTSLAVIDVAFVMGGLAMSALLLSFIVFSAVAGLGRARSGIQALRESNLELQASRDALAAQSRQLERRARYLEVTAAVAQDAASMLAVEELLSRATALIADQFGYYHVGLFLLDSSGEWAVLQAASSEGGRRMLARGHRLRVGQEGIVGDVVGRGESHIALDVGVDAAYLGNPELPATRSELTFPLRARGEIIGALDIQSAQQEACGEEDIAVLEALADQLAVSISSVRLLRQVQESLDAERQAYGEFSRGAWRDLLHARSDLGFVKEQGVISTAKGVWEPGMEQVLSTGEVALGGDEEGDAAIPVRVRDQVVGVMNARKPADAGAWTTYEIAILEELAGQLGIALESARLYQDTQRRAARERLVGDIADHLQRAPDLEMLMQSAAKELKQVVGGSRAYVRLGMDERRNESDNGGESRTA
jgi:GAF domain-containing protein